jgi:putative flippase GtrA
MKTHSPDRATPPAGGLLQQLSMQSVRFLLAGGCGAATDLTLYALLNRAADMPALAANLVSRPCGGIVSFTLNKTWTFRTQRQQQPTHRQFARYGVIWISCFAFSEALLGIYHNLLGLEAGLAKVAAESTLGIFSFLAQKFWTFR